MLHRILGTIRIFQVLLPQLLSHVKLQLPFHSEQAELFGGHIQDDTAASGSIGCFLSLVFWALWSLESCEHQHPLAETHSFYHNSETIFAMAMCGKLIHLIFLLWYLCKLCITLCVTLCITREWHLPESMSRPLELVVQHEANQKGWTIWSCR